ncbi:MAG: nucleotidyltransferase family protein [Anaerolineae bacterium]|nr:nucleotidyltransferase family protein [Anaerolineae bacterium]
MAEQYGATNVRVFGSVARGEAREDSDVDFLVEFRKGTSIFELAGLRLDLMDLLSHDVDLVPEDSLKPHVRPWAIRDAKPL